MRSLFANIRNLVLPSSAGVGQARLFIGPDLPPPLNSYVTTDGPYAWAIVMYSQGDDTTYSYIGGVEDSVASITIAEWGHVVAGSVVELSPNVPMALRRSANLGGATQENSANSFFFDATSRFVASALIEAQLAAPQVTLDATDTVVSGQLRWRSTPVSADAVSVEGTDNGGMSGTNTVYGATMTGGVAGSVLGQAFVAPPSGAVLVLWRSGLDNTTATGVGYCAPQLRDGAVVNAGTLVTAASDPVALQHEGTAQRRGGTFDVVFGLTAGASYNFTLMQRSSAGANTAAFADRALAVIPVLGP